MISLLSDKKEDFKEGIIQAYIVSLKILIPVVVNYIMIMEMLDLDIETPTYPRLLVPILDQKSTACNHHITSE